MPVDAGLFLFRDLEQRDPKLLLPRRAETPFEAGVDVPTLYDLQPGAYEMVKTVISDVGNATVLAEGAFDFPVVDASATEDRYRVLMCVSGFTLDFQSERHENFASAQGLLRLRAYDTKIRTCIRAIQERRDRIAAFGDSRLNIRGLLNVSGVTVDNNSFNPYTASAASLAAFFISLVESFYTGSDTALTPNTALVSTGLYFRMLSLTMPDSGLTVKEHLEKALSKEGMPFSIRDRRHCNSANLEAAGVHAPGTNRDRIVLYRLDPEVIERHVEAIQLAPSKYYQVKGLTTLYPMFGCTTPSIVNYLRAIQYTDVIRAA